MHMVWLILLLLLTISMHRIKKKLEPSTADTAPITNVCRERKAIQIETIDQDSEFTEFESLFDYEKSKSTVNYYFSWVIL